MNVEPPIKNLADQFMKTLGELSHSGQSRWRVFTDFCEMAYCAIAKTTSQEQERKDELENRYMQTVKVYTREQANKIAHLLAFVVQAMEVRRRDMLGEIYEEMGFSDQKYGAQFFTPWDLCKLVSSLTIGEEIPDKPVLTLHEPACGSGRLVMSAAEHLQEHGIDPTTRLWADAIDKDKTCFQMAFINLSYAGIPAVVRHGNTLSLEMYESALTPTGLILLATKGDCIFKEAATLQIRKLDLDVSKLEIPKRRLRI